MRVLSLETIGSSSTVHDFSAENGRPNDGFNVKRGLSGPIDLFKSSGGGAMGSHAFVLQNMDETFPKVNGANAQGTGWSIPDRIVADGGLKLQRR